LCIDERLHERHFRVFRKLMQRLSSQPAERQREEKEEAEDGNRKPTGAKFASGKATSDYFI